MIKYSDCDGVEVRLDCVEMLLKSGHLAPTCPDTLWSLPFPPGIDPFVIEKLPDLVVVGNMMEGRRVVEIGGEKCLVVLLEGFKCGSGGMVVVECGEMKVDVVRFANNVES
jgi:DNA polymerase delta subunit 2